MNMYQNIYYISKHYHLRKYHHILWMRQIEIDNNRNQKDITLFLLLLDCGHENSSMLFLLLLVLLLLLLLLLLWFLLLLLLLMMLLLPLLLLIMMLLVDVFLCYCYCGRHCVCCLCYFGLCCCYCWCCLHLSLPLTINNAICLPILFKEIFNRHIENTMIFLIFTQFKELFFRLFTIFHNFKIFLRSFNSRLENVFLLSIFYFWILSTLVNLHLNIWICNWKWLINVSFNLLNSLVSSHPTLFKQNFISRI